MTYTAFDLTGKTALITGGNGGIGLGMAEALAQAGANVLIWGTNADKNAAALAKLQSAGKAQYQTAQVNVADEAAVDEAFAQAVKDFGAVHSVFANSGIGRMGKSFDQMKTQDYRDVMAVNLDGVFFTMRAAARHMVERASKGDTGGSLIGVASTAALEGAARNQHYGASKAGVVAMMRGLAVEYARYGIRANSLLPGWIATDMTQTAQDSDVFNNKVIGRVPMQRWGRGDEFGGIAVYLASDASSFHSGDSIVIDGGYTIF
jgi:NAD(P)-dependent dehydrogenase (short-subunit alcohol dehydrogenase family)